MEIHHAAACVGVRINGKKVGWLSHPPKKVEGKGRHTINTDGAAEGTVQNLHDATPPNAKGDKKMPCQGALGDWLDVPARPEIHQENLINLMRMLE